MNYVIVYDAQTKIKMTQAEVQKFLQEIKKSDIVEFKGQFLTKFFRVIAKEEITEGRLHDGTRVTKINGIWKDKHDPTVKLNHSYYPELTTDNVMSEEQYQSKRLEVNKK